MVQDKQGWNVDMLPSVFTGLENRRESMLFVEFRISEPSSRQQAAIHRRHLRNKAPGISAKYSSTDLALVPAMTSGQLSCCNYHTHAQGTCSPVLGSLGDASCNSSKTGRRSSCSGAVEAQSKIGAGSHCSSSRAHLESMQVAARARSLL